MLGSELKSATVYTDFQGLSNLRREAGQNSEQALEETARQFEALFVQMMLKSMREAGQGEGLFDSEQSDLYRDMYDKQLSLSLTEKGEGMGLAKMLVQQLRGTQAAQPAADSAAATAGGFAVPARGLSGFELKSGIATPPVPGETASAAVATPTFESPEQFVAQLAPHAQQAAQRLGVDPKALLAQAALETGWGKAVISHPDGASSHNLFNIKADSRWDGQSVAKQTLEYRQGVATREVAQFRSYDSFAASFDDYVNFLQSSPRYADALRQADDPKQFAHSLQEAGYATDPAYASKIGNILDRGALSEAALTLKSPEPRTLS
ncbi:MAG: flagellar assembly peptidoglycan hydrolase FlgJ [Gammaproteobacteria bacterium]|nr:flagellar assembly peptidoglycan hydrolase FlgJ [Gammaproteobacteria bacterium]